MLDLNHLELIEARLTVLSQKLTQIKEKRVNGESEDSGKVNNSFCRCNLRGVKRRS